MPDSATVADLMSRGAQTLSPDAPLESVIRRMRLIGHEGFPVIEHGRVIGLLTRRDADRALEHGLGSLPVRDVMSAGEVTLRPDDPVSLLEWRMVESGWGQIPVVDNDSRLIGIVTRTDLIKYWARSRPAAPTVLRVDAAQMERVLGEPAAALISRIAREAQEQRLNLYMVGGVVRDLLLERPSDDVDFVVEADAITFAHGLQARYGGQVHSYKPFGTATWMIEGGHPDHVDFATARSEFYEHPTALPTVYTGSIKLDLARRDFTINTLAVQLSPAQGQGRVLDEFGGLPDLRAGLIRVLHSLSFVDDPTRILRAVRFERRLGFRIEARTAQLIDTALPMLRRITGERVRNELALLLAEPDPGGSFLLMQSRGILAAIHPAFVVPDDLPTRFQSARANPPPWPMLAPDPADLGWCLLLADIPVGDLPALVERLHFSRALADALTDAARIVQNLDGLTDPATPPSAVDARLSGIGDLALYAAWIIVKNQRARERIRLYASEWRDVRPATGGHDLRRRGLPPGPCYGRILARLRAARLDGELADDAGEQRLLETLLEGDFCHDGAE
jgi:tRNA nucleotidyltransferase (CCA-adding enzyme)